MYRPLNLTETEWLEYKKEVIKPDRTWNLKMTIDLEDGTHLDLDENDIIADSLVFKEQSTCSSNIMVGSTFANSLNFSLVNNDGRFRQYNFANGKVAAIVSLYIPSLEKWAEVKLGTFVIQSAGKKYSTIPIQCMDAMCLFNRPLEDVNPIFPMSLKVLFQKVCLLANVSYSSELYDEIPGIILKDFDASKMSCRDFLANIGCLIGQNLRMSRANQLEGFWYEESDFTTTPDTRVNITVNDLTVHPTAVSVKSWDDSQFIPDEADTTYLMNFEKNPLIQNDDMAIIVMDKLNLLFTSVQYKIYNCQFIGDPTIQAGDTVTHNLVIEEQELYETVDSLVMSHEYHFRGTGTISAIGQTAEQDKQLTADAKKILEVEAKAAKDLNEGLTLAQQALLKQSNLLTESLALYGGTKYNADGQFVGYYMASEPIFAEDSIIAPDDSNVDPREDCYVWTYGQGVGVSDTGYFGVYSGIDKDKSIIARSLTADWIRAGVLSALDDTLQIDLSSGTQTLQAVEGWGQTVLDGIGVLLNYWNRNVTSSETDGPPKLAYLRITADADETDSSETKTVADLKLVWETYDGQMRTSMGHTIAHAPDGSTVDSYGEFSIKSSQPIHISPSLYYDEALLFDNIIMRRTKTASENTGIDFIIAPDSLPSETIEEPEPPKLEEVPEGQVNLLPNPGFEEAIVYDDDDEYHENGYLQDDRYIEPWNNYHGDLDPDAYYIENQDFDLIHSGNCALVFNPSISFIYLTLETLEKIGIYDKDIYIGFWIKGEDATRNALLYTGVYPTAENLVEHLEISTTKEWQYFSTIVPKLDRTMVLGLYYIFNTTTSIDDFYFYDAQGYSKEQWDAYVLKDWPDYIIEEEN